MGERSGGCGFRGGDLSDAIGAGDGGREGGVGGGRGGRRKW